MMSNIVHRRFQPLILILLLLLLLPCSFTVSLSKSRITNITTDQLALLALKSRIIELPSNHVLSKNWTLGSSVCDWIGVTCGSRHRRVTALHLSGMKLTGTIPPQLGNLSFLVSINMTVNNLNGGLPDELSRLRRLKVLDLSYNNLNGNFPPWIGSFKELEFLSFWNNSFTGAIPQSISNMSKLTVFSVWNNKLQGNFPAGLFNMSSLERVDLDDNVFSASSLPDDLCRNLPKIKSLGLGRTGLVGQIPSTISQCLQLRELWLNHNSLRGSIPKEIGNLQGLRALALEKNQLEGVIPKEIGNLSLLQTVDLNNNYNISGAIPEEIGKLSDLQFINLEFNKLTGFIPVHIFNISTITLLSFAGNDLYGNIPVSAGYNLPNLEHIYLEMNSLTGAIPNSISNCSNLQTLELSDNHFTGPVPNSLGDLRLLQRLYIHQNNLISDPSSPILNFISSLSNCIYLELISMGDNPLDGILPDSVGNLSSTLQYMYAHNCRIGGTIPSGIGNLSTLSLLDLNGNQLVGLLPSTMKNMQKLQGLYLGTNKMSISLQLFCACKNLGFLALQGNHIVGDTIPDCLGNITSMRELFLYSNGLNSSIPVSLWNLKDLLKLDLSSNLLTGSLPPEISNLKVAVFIDFSNNYFSGNIPSTITNLENLQNLSLAHNQLQGHIPEAIGNMLALQQLDLSYNFLSGSVPMSMEKLQDLVFFNVSFNNLSGEIPSGGPFANFTAESFISNQALCGATKYHVQPCPDHLNSRVKTSMNLHKFVVILVVLISFASITSLGLIYQKYRNKRKANNVVQEGFSSKIHRRISYYKLLRATDNYSKSNLLGTGSFGSVYKGTLEDGQIVAVKVFNLQVEGSFKNFDTESEVLRNLRHRNLRKVISCCSNPDFKALVLEYMPNHSLDRWLHSSNYILNVTQRLNILIDVAYALQYLHYGYSKPVVHCDLKPSNVLLDNEMVAHVSDFGIAKFLGKEGNTTFTKTLPTLGYVAPEYASEGQVSTRCDIYSFGILIMEVFTRKCPSDKMFGETLTLRSWVQESMPDRLSTVIDVELLSTFSQHFHEILVKILSIMDIALTCTTVSPRERCSIEEVLGSLNKIKLQMLPHTNGSC
ncbi:OLC1v1025450C1 [Oldenlandia corymbosa var. corymbosa]|uniref:non-specific serine/threonine protein kinase n=1 Tax=Oldenlandia corymbosa var. corymbosa TaxID=529605 RepID=A0AAV1C5A5_OLDCO|nr:OLC1v1025450C1 [Oldenlandia corymbosa var. corymbosa]